MGGAFLKATYFCPADRESELIEVLDEERTVPPLAKPLQPAPDEHLHEKAARRRIRWHRRCWSANTDRGVSQAVPNTVVK